MAFSLNDFLPAAMQTGGPVIPIIRLSGAIGAVSPLRGGLTLAGLAGALDRAFGVKAAPAVGLIINSPGGAAVQSHQIFDRIRSLADEKKKKVIVGVEDVAASGGYMIALAGDEIVVDPSSIVGSIGVVSAGFGFQDLIARIGVERRVHTAGQNKVMLDPFQAERAEDVARLESLQRDVHEMFITMVKARRGMKLKDDPDLFTGAFWSGTRSVELGLADRIGDLRSVLRSEYGPETRMKLISSERSWRRRLGLVGSEHRVAIAVEGSVAAIEERLMWNRFGL